MSKQIKGTISSEKNFTAFDLDILTSRKPFIVDGCPTMTHRRYKVCDATKTLLDTKTSQVLRFVTQRPFKQRRNA